MRAWAIIGLLAAAGGPAAAGVYSDELGRCLVDSTTPADRIEMIRWMAFAFATHPDLSATVTVDEAARQGTDRYVGELFTDLLVARCREQSVEALRYEGQAAIGSAFQVLGAVASGDLMGNPDVQGSLTGFMGYADMAGIEALLAQ